MIRLAADKITHLKGGLLALLGSAGLAIALLAVGAHALTVALAVAGLAAGGAVEGAQAAVNRAAIARGVAPPHEVSASDLLASAAPCWAACVVIEALRAWGVL